MPSLSSTVSSIRPAAPVARCRPLGHPLSRVEGASLEALSSTILSDPIPLIDREHELEVIRGKLLSETVRLLTLIGPGGIGKTRLALAAAGSLQAVFADGARVVQLGSFQDAGCLPSAIAQALGLRELTEQSLWKRVVAHLADRHLLLILDNFEHFLTAAPRVGELLAACPRLKVLTTSRESLNLRLEYRMPLRGLSLPVRGSADPAAVADSASGALFLAHARRVQPDLVLGPAEARALADLLHRLDGLPLAIKIAASQSNTLSPSAMLSRLQGQALLSTEGARDMPERQRSLREAIAWSYRLLTSADQAMFRQLGVFAGGWTLDAAETIVQQADPGSPLWRGLAVLVDKSLVQSGRAAHGEDRYRMLEIVREYAAEQLAAHGELAAVQQRHAAYYLTLGERAAPGFWGPQESVWARRLEEEIDNFRAALWWATAQEAPAFSLRLVGALAEFWWLRGWLPEGRWWFDQALARPGESPPAIRARALLGAGTLALAQGDGLEARARLQECQVLAEASPEPVLQAGVLARLGMLAELRGEPAEAQALLETSLTLSRMTGDAREMAFALVHLGRMRFSRGDLDGAEGALAEGLSLYRSIGNQRAIAITIGNLAYLKVKRRHYPALAALAAEGLEAAHQSGYRRAIAFAARTAAFAGAHQGNHTQAARLVAAIEAWGENTVDVVDFAVHEPEVPEELRVHLRPHPAERETLAMPADEVVELARACLERPRGGRDGVGMSRATERSSSVLSERERTVLRLIGEGLPNKQIASALSIAERTVKSHLTSAMNKLGVDNRAHAAVAAVQRGLLS